MEVDLKDARARVSAEEDGLDPALIPPAVVDAGFTPGPVELTAVGTMEETEAGPVLEMDGRLSELALEAAEGVELPPGGPVRVTGTLEVPEEGPPMLTVDAVEKLEP